MLKETEEEFGSFPYKIGECKCEQIVVNFACSYRCMYGVNRVVVIHQMIMVQISKVNHQDVGKVIFSACISPAQRTPEIALTPNLGCRLITLTNVKYTNI